MSHLKIDRSFLKGAPENAYDSALMEAIVNVGHKLDLKIVVEGVETQSQSDYCKSLNVEFVQGFLHLLLGKLQFLTCKPPCAGAPNSPYVATVCEP